MSKFDYNKTASYDAGPTTPSSMYPAAPRATSRKMLRSLEDDDHPWSFANTARSKLDPFQEFIRYQGAKSPGERAAIRRAEHQEIMAWRNEKAEEVNRLRDVADSANPLPGTEASLLLARLYGSLKA